MTEAIATPGSLPAALFSVRARGLLSTPVPGAARARLSGLLIGAEIAAMRDLWPGAPVTLLGDPGLTAHYMQAMKAAAIPASAEDGAALSLAGLCAAFRQAAMKPE